MSSSVPIEDEEWLANHLSLGADGILTNPLNPVPAYLKRVEGIDKLRRSFAKELSNPDCIRDKSSNLPHLLSIVKCIWPRQEPGKVEADQAYHNDMLSKCPAAVLKPFVFSEGKTGRLLVDIVSSDGTTWYKISARNPKSLALVAAGEGGYGKKSIVDHALDYMKCAEENPCLFRPPKVVVIFTSGVSSYVVEQLESIGAEVIGRVIEDTQLEAHPRIKVLQEWDTKALQRNSLSEAGEEEEVDDAEEQVNKYTNPSLEGVDKLNLDLSTFLCYLSNLTNGHDHVNFKKGVLANQAVAERLHPQKPVLDKVFEGRQLFCCETALREFKQILDIVGGPEEKVRAAKFLAERVTIVPDQMTEKASLLPISGNIKERSVIIFSTGDAIKAVTVTSNSGFVRSARSQGVNFPAFVHESRALTEQKEMSPDHVLP